MPAAVTTAREPAPFDDSRKALKFALNHHMVATPTAVMNAMMAAVAEPPKKIAKKKTSKKFKEAELLLEAMGIDPLDLLAKEQAAKDRKSLDLLRHMTPRWTRMDAAHQAGLILAHFGRMDREHQEVLAGCLTIPSRACNCRQPCCSGWRATERWTAAVRSTCETLMHRAELSTLPGKKPGLSSQPLLRQLLVELYFLKEGPTLTDIAGRSQVSLVTAAKHRAWIHEYLEAAENAAWKSIDAIFDQAGITGSPE